MRRGAMPQFGICLWALSCLSMCFRSTTALQVDLSSRPSGATWKRTQCGGPSGDADLRTPWTDQVSPATTPLPEYPRPMQVRAAASALRTTTLSTLRDTGDPSNWQNLNGMWEWEAAGANGTVPSGRALESSILVPFPVEACLSGRAPASSAAAVQRMWYRLALGLEARAAGSRLLLHFGAVDWQTTVYFNGKALSALEGPPPRPASAPQARTSEARVTAGARGGGPRRVLPEGAGARSVGDDPPTHTGGYDGFSVDVTEQLAARGPQELLVHVYDPSDLGAQPNGKQRISAIDHPSGDQYTPSSGIWQTVWLEEVPLTYISGLQIGADLAEIQVTATLAGAAEAAAGVAWKVQLKEGERAVASQEGSTSSTAFTTKFAPPAPLRLWGPRDPFLYTLVVTAGNDTITSYAGMRSLTEQNITGPPRRATGPQERLDMPLARDLPGMPLNLTAPSPDLCWGHCNTTAGCKAWVYSPANCSCGGVTSPVPQCFLKAEVASNAYSTCRYSGVQASDGRSVKAVFNEERLFLAGWLDQSWWPDGQYTAPTDAALRSDLAAVARFGLNMVRLHQKVNSERWYYHADLLGVLVMQDAVQKYGSASNATIQPFRHDLVAMIRGRGNHPCIVQWETFNEADCWMVFKEKPNTVADIVALARATDWQDRLVDTDSGGSANSYRVGDVDDVHTYPYPTSGVKPTPRKYAMYGEFGGLGAFVKGKEWVPGGCHTYLRAASPQDEAEKYAWLLTSLRAQVSDVSASVYTQITDTELECDGFLNYDRSDKFNATQVALIKAANDHLIAAAAAAHPPTDHLSRPHHARPIRATWQE